MRGSSRIEQSRKHGPFDPRFRRRPSAPPRSTRVGERSRTVEEHRVKGGESEFEAIKAWESEGGAFTPLPQTAAMDRGGRPELTDRSGSTGSPRLPSRMR
jgi:hypothetical protein